MAISTAHLSQKARPWLVTFRAAEWWEYKLIPIFALFYATGVLLDVPLITLWPQVLALLLALVPGAIYVSVLNDLTDRCEDLAAGKRNRLVGRSRSAVATLLALPLVFGVGIMFMWRHDPLVLSLYVAAWLAFTCYSAPPIRLKTRGFAGAFADASGAHLFPSLLAVVLTFRAAQWPIDVTWLSGVGLWSLAYGLRGILWHQLSDVANDRAAGVRTFAQRHTRKWVVAIASYTVFPLEVTALGLLLAQLNEPIAWLGCAAYGLMIAAKIRLWGMHTTIVDSGPRCVLILHEYYDVFLPLSVLGIALVRAPLDTCVLALHLLLFPRRALQIADEGIRLLQRVVRRFV